MKLISVITPCYNEEENIHEVYERVKKVFCKLDDYSYEHVFIDNASTDRTVEMLKDICKSDHRAKLIVNTRNFGSLKSPYHALLEIKSDASILLTADLQDPPELIEDFLKYWEEGYKVVVGVKPKSKESKVMFMIRKIYYSLITKIAEVELIKNFMGFGLYSQEVIQVLKRFDEREPYLRGLISEIGYPVKEVKYVQAKRKRGVSKNNFFSLYDTAMLGITSHSKLPLRIATILGFITSCFSFLVAIFYLAAKILFWDRFVIGQASIAIGLFFMGSIQLFCIGIVGEYIALINSRIMKRPLTIEKERVNFENCNEVQKNLKDEEYTRLNV